MVNEAFMHEIQSALGLEQTELLGTAGQKTILRGTLSGAPAAGKIVHLSGVPANDLVTRTRAQREVELLATVDSPYVVRVLTDAIEIGDPPKAVAWVEEWLDGEDLAKHFTEPMAEPEVWNLIRDVAKALEACHSLEVVHRDLSPNNVRRKSDGTYVLMDPGLARHLAKSALTGSFQPGTPGWRSPEHILGGEPVPSSDIFCLGILAFVARTGTFPIDPTLPQDQYDRVLLSDQAPPIESFDPTVSNHLAAVINQSLQRQPARRFLDGSELLDNLQDIGKGN